ncbi:beta-ketoacyl synthase N-terminal-like domain-containing protein [Paenibacillus tyrfis]|uniref:beta-ketoacyl synthase N-terminal-like domain-containing protein n=1 Tax=Paenibacillus tyrfis TaxID=1501230 RepID=UPI000B597FC7|nr:beta-ketoacyl synthase N-terminal-like domain-containing protein [Paenibacillus tyrfis]
MTNDVQVQVLGVGAITKAGFGAAFAGSPPSVIETGVSAALVPDSGDARLKRMKKWSRSSQLACLAVHEALSGQPEPDPVRTAIVIGADYTNLEAILAMDAEAKQYGVNGTNPALFPETVLNVIGGHLSSYFRIAGVNVTISSGSHTGLKALGYAADLLRLGLADRVIVCVVLLLPPPPFGQRTLPCAYERESVAALLLGPAAADAEAGIALRSEEAPEAEQRRPLAATDASEVPLAIVSAVHRIRQEGCGEAVIATLDESGNDVRLTLLPHADGGWR